MRLRRDCFWVRSIAVCTEGGIHRLFSVPGNATAARSLDTLRERNITHILTLDIVPLPEYVTEKPHLTTKYIRSKR